MSKWIALAAAAALISAGSAHAAVKASTRNGALAGAAGGAVVAGPIGAVVGGVGGAVVGHHAKRHHACRNAKGQVVSCRKSRPRRR